jgi:hypothetical protein
MCWTRSKRLAVEEHVLLLDAERVRLARAEAVVEHARAARRRPPGGPVMSGGTTCFVGSTASASISTFQRGRAAR